VKVFFQASDCKREIQMHWDCANVPAVVPFHGSFSCKQKETKAIVVNYVEGKILGQHEDNLTTPQEKLEDTIEFARQLFEFLQAIRSLAPHRPIPLLHLDLYFENIFWINRD
jgi:hypothetical protein